MSAKIDVYFVMGCNADGLTFDGPLTSAELEKRLSEGYYGDSRTRFRESVPNIDGFCPMFEDDELLIIRGSVVKPKAAEKVTRWEVPR